MIRTYTKIATLDDTLRIWRYMDFTKLANLVLTGKLWFNRIDCFQDVYEGTYPKQNIDILQKKILRVGGSNFRGGKIIEKSFRKRMYVCCFHQNEFESDAMWKLYAHSGGVAVKTDIGRIKRALEFSNQDITISRVKYIDFDSEGFLDNNVINLGVYKRKSFEYEQEVRLLFISEERDNPETGIPIQVNVNELLSEVYISPYAPSYLAPTLRAFLEKMNLNVPVIKSPLLDLNKRGDCNGQTKF